MKTLKRLFVVLVMCLAFVFTGCDKTIPGGLQASADAFETAFKKEYKSLIKGDLDLLVATTEGASITWSFSRDDILNEDGSVKETLPNGGLAEDGKLLTITLTATITGSKEEGSVTKDFEFTLDKSLLTADAKLVNSVKGIVETNYQNSKYSSYAMKLDEQKNTIYYINLINRSDVTITYTDTEFLDFEGAKATLKKMPQVSEYESADRQYKLQVVTYTVTKGDISITSTINLLLCNYTEDLSDALSLADLNELLDTNTYLEDASYKIYGTVTKVYCNQYVSDLSNNIIGFYMQDGSDGFYIWRATVDGDAIISDVNPGDVVLVNTKVGSYDGVYESSTVNSISVLEKCPSGVDVESLITPLVLTKDNFNDELNKSQAIYASASDIIYIEGAPASGSAHKITFLFKDSLTPIYLSYDKNNTIYSEISSFFTTLQTGDVINVKGVIGSSSYEPRLVVADNSFEKSENQLTADELNEIAKLYSSSFAPKTTYGIDLTSTSDKLAKKLQASNCYGDAITWSIEDLDSQYAENIKIVDLNKTNKKVSVTGLTDQFFVPFTLVASWTHNEVASSMKFKTCALGLDNKATLSELLKNQNPVENTLIEAYISYVYGDYALVSASDGTQVIAKAANTNVKFSEGYAQLIVNSISTVNGHKEINVNYVPSIVETDLYIAPKSLALNELDNSFGGYVMVDSVTVSTGKATVGSIEISFLNEDETALADGAYKCLAGYYIPTSSTTAKFISYAQFESFEDINKKNIGDTALFIGTFLACYTNSSNATYGFIVDRLGNAIHVYAQKQVWINAEVSCGDTVVIEGKLFSQGDSAKAIQGCVCITMQKLIKCANNLGFDGIDVQENSTVVTDLKDLPITANNKEEGASLGARAVYTCDAICTNIDLTNKALKFKFVDTNQQTGFKEDEMTVYANFDFVNEVNDLIDRLANDGIVNKEAKTTVSTLGTYTFKVSFVVNKYLNGEKIEYKLYYIPSSITWSK